jgi:hypothetical protein
VGAGMIGMMLQEIFVSLADGFEALLDALV